MTRAGLVCRLVNEVALTVVLKRKGFRARTTRVGINLAGDATTTDDITTTAQKTAHRAMRLDIGKERILCRLAASLNAIANATWTAAFLESKHFATLAWSLLDAVNLSSLLHRHDRQPQILRRLKLRCGEPLRHTALSMDPGSTKVALRPH
jgi:hypothetical protein